MNAWQPQASYPCGNFSDTSRMMYTSRRPSGLRKTTITLNSLAHRTTWLRSDFFGMIGRADIEGSKSYVAMNAWQPQASYPCGNFSDTSRMMLSLTKGSIGHAFTVLILTENSNQMSFCPFTLREVSVLSELILGHLCYLVADVPPQPNSLSASVIYIDHTANNAVFFARNGIVLYTALYNRISRVSIRVVVFQVRLLSHLCYTSNDTPQRLTRVKLNRVFFPRFLFQTRSLGCGFAR